MYLCFPLYTSTCLYSLNLFLWALFDCFEAEEIHDFEDSDSVISPNSGFAKDCVLEFETMDLFAYCGFTVLKKLLSFGMVWLDLNDPISPICPEDVGNVLKCR